MKPKDIGIFVLLIIILVVLFLIYKKSKMYDHVLTAVGVKTGAISAQEAKPAKKISKVSDSNEDDGEEEDIKPIKLNPVQKQIISLFEDGLPKTTKQIKEAYNEKFKKSLDNVKFNNSITNMRQSGAMLSEKVDGTNYWGPEEWFEEEWDIFLEEYANKVPELANKDLEN